MTSTPQTPEPEPIPFGDLPYDRRTPRAVIDDYVLIRGDLDEEYAREQLANQVNRWTAEAVRVERESAEQDRRLLAAFSTAERDLRTVVEYLQQQFSNGWFSISEETFKEAFTENDLGQLYDDLFTP